MLAEIADDHDIIYLLIWQEIFHFMSEAEIGWKPEEKTLSSTNGTQWKEVPNDLNFYFKEWKRTREMFKSNINKNVNNLSFCFRLWEFALQEELLSSVCTLLFEKQCISWKMDVNHF